MRSDKLDFLIEAKIIDLGAVERDLAVHFKDRGFLISTAETASIASAMTTFQSSKNSMPKPSPSTLEQQVRWIRRSAAELRHSLGGDEFRDAFIYLRAGSTLHAIHDQLSALDVVLQQDESDLAEKIRNPPEISRRTSRRHLFVLAVAESYLRSYPETDRITSHMIGFIRLVFDAAGEALKTDEAVRTLLRSVLGHGSVVGFKSRLNKEITN
ncbi:MAG: hypothetical protein WBA44_11605 [Mesorhizobium sp.]